MALSFSQRIQRKVRSSTRRSKKYVRQMMTYKDSKGFKPAPVFLVGCQRSGTTMLAQVLDKSLQTWVYHEDARKAFDNYRIKPASERRRLISKARCRWVVFKPICDSQNIDRLLADHPDAKAIWIFRRYQDVVNSALRKWGGRQLELIHQTATNENWEHWFVERMSAERRQFVKEAYHDGMSSHTAGALKWYLRNEIYFDCNLGQRSDQVKLVRYEDLVAKPLDQYKAIFEFLDLEFDLAYVSSVFATSIRRDDFPAIDPQVERVCEDMMNRLNSALEVNITPSHTPRLTSAPECLLPHPPMAHQNRGLE